MKLYKYKSLKDPWFVLDMIVNRRLYCAHWSELNDPLEGRYELYLGKKSSRLASIMTSRIEEARDSFRVASLSADPTNFLMWSHYADGHKGVVLEVDIPEEHPGLTKVIYTAFSSVFSEKAQTLEDMRHLFNGKGEEWAYEQEYRIITDSKFFNLGSPIQRVLIGPAVDCDKQQILRELLPDDIEIVDMELDQVQGTLKMHSPDNTVQPTPAPSRFSEAEVNS